MKLLGIFGIIIIFPEKCMGFIFIITPLASLPLPQPAPPVSLKITPEQQQATLRQTKIISVKR